MTGTTLGGLITGGALMVIWYALAHLEGARTAAVIGVGALAAAALVWPRTQCWLPESARQVPSALMRIAPERAAFRWGIELGTGVSTFVVTPAMYALLAVAIGQPRPLLVAALLGFYGASRGAVIAYFAVAYARRGTRTNEGLLGLGVERTLHAPLLVAVAAAVVLAVA